ncbi:unnamed protein product [Urochloa humidicola]
MASTTRILLLSAAFLLLVAALHTTYATAAGGGVPSYCTVGQAIPRNTLPGCSWYAASRSTGACKQLAPMFPAWAYREMCCQQLAEIPAECRCRALRLMPPLQVGGPAGSAASEECGKAQVKFVPSVVTKGECDLPTIHGGHFCLALDAE